MRGIKIPYEDNHKEINGVLHKLCNQCKEWFPCTDEYFYKTNSKNGRLRPDCKKCTIIKSTKRIKEHYREFLDYKNINNQKPHIKEKRKIYSRGQRERGEYKEWQQNNKDKLKEYRDFRESNKMHTITKEEWLNCKEYFNNTCAYCGLPLEEHYNKFAGEPRHTDFHREHVDHNGANDLSNCVPSCKTCNSSKYDWELENWYSKQKFYSEERLDKIHKWLNEDYIQYIREHKPKRKYNKKDSILIENKSQLDY